MRAGGVLAPANPITEIAKAKSVDGFFQIVLVPVIVPAGVQAVLKPRAWTRAKAAREGLERRSTKHVVEDVSSHAL